jgi:hypothetical protein
VNHPNNPEHSEAHLLESLYVLDADHNPARPASLMAWAEFMGRTPHLVDLDELPKCTVSTVFLGIDHNFFGGRPTLFETAVFFRDGHFSIFDRYETWAKAEKGHMRAVKQLSK